MDERAKFHIVATSLSRKFSNFSSSSFTDILDQSPVSLYAGEEQLLKQAYESACSTPINKNFESQHVFTMIETNMAQLDAMGIGPNCGGGLIECYKEFARCRE